MFDRIIIEAILAARRPEVAATARIKLAVLVPRHEFVTGQWFSKAQ